jgi:hypothetical protein
MFRLVLLSLVLAIFLESAQAGFLDDLKAQAEARRAETIKAGKMPPVRLNEKQMAKLKDETGPRSEITWVKAGRQKDGKTFVCHVISGTDYIGRKHVSLLAGTFEADGSYRQSAARYHSKDAVLKECNSNGLEPPVTVKRRF